MGKIITAVGKTIFRNYFKLNQLHLDKNLDIMCSRLNLTE